MCFILVEFILFVHYLQEILEVKEILVDILKILLKKKV